MIIIGRKKLVSNMVVRIENVSKIIGKKEIVKDLNMEIKEGEIFGFLGPNGAGKTTTIKMLLGLASITSGEIVINNHSIKKNFRKAIGSVGGIVENPELYKYMSGYDNLLHFARMHGNISRERIDEIVEFIGLENRINDKVKKYSLGMRQRLGIAQALLHKPKLLVLDEPTNGLDPGGIKELRDKLRELALKENLAVLVSSHLLSEMELMCDRVAIIKNGRILDVRNISELNYDENIFEYLLDCQDIDKALVILKEMHSDVELSKGYIKVKLNKEEISNIVQVLSQNSIRTYEIKRTSKTLEDEFLEITGGDKIE